MNEIIQNLEANATNGKENFCYISENKLNALKELSKREYEELKKKQDVIDEAIKFMEKELGNISEDTSEFTAYGDLDYAQDEVEELYRILKEVE